MGIGIGAAHLAKQALRTKLRHRLFKRELDINGNVAAVMFAFAVMLVLVQHFALHAAGQRGGPFLSVDMAAGIGDEDVYEAFEQIKGSGAAFAFMKDKFSLIKVALHDGAAVEVKKRSRDMLEDGKLAQLFNIARRAMLELVADGNFVGKRTSRTGNHALAAGDAGRGAHGL